MRSFHVCCDRQAALAGRPPTVCCGFSFSHSASPVARFGLAMSTMPLQRTVAKEGLGQEVGVGKKIKFCGSVVAVAHAPISGNTARSALQPAGTLTGWQRVIVGRRLRSRRSCTQCGARRKRQLGQQLHRRNHCIQQQQLRRNMPAAAAPRWLALVMVAVLLVGTRALQPPPLSSRPLSGRADSDSDGGLNRGYRIANPASSDWAPRFRGEFFEIDSPVIQTHYSEVGAPGARCRAGGGRRGVRSPLPFFPLFHPSSSPSSPCPCPILPGPNTPFPLHRCSGRSSPCRCRTPL